jgi:hypothetical protein
MDVYWNSWTVRDWRALGYDYPEFVGLNPSDVQGQRFAIIQRVTALYGAFGSPVFFAARTPSPAVATRMRALAMRPVQDAESGKSQKSEHTQWTVRVHADQYALRESFTVLIFINHSKGSKTDCQAPSYVGCVTAFVNPTMERCQNCKKHEDAKFEGVVYLNEQIVARSSLNSLLPDEVLPWLTKKITWRVQKVGAKLHFYHFYGDIDVFLTV